MLKSLKLIDLTKNYVSIWKRKCQAGFARGFSLSKGAEVFYCRVGLSKTEALASASCSINQRKQLKKHSNGWRTIRQPMHKPCRRLEMKRMRGGIKTSRSFFARAEIWSMLKLEQTLKEMRMHAY